MDNDELAATPGVEYIDIDALLEMVKAEAESQADQHSPSGESIYDGTSESVAWIDRIVPR